tara:strand:+ start:212 stop:811 length:600 start_codon:yes stop_codon:yes gene_type:complete
MYKKGKNNGPDSLTSHIKGKGGKVRKLSNGGLTTAIQQLTELGGGDAGKGLEKFMRQTRAKEGQMDNRAYGLGVMAESMRAITYPPNVDSSITPQDVYIGRGKEGPLREYDALEDSIYTKEGVKGPLKRTVAMAKVPAHYLGKMSDHDKDRKLKQEALWQSKIDNEELISDEEYVRRSGIYKKGGIAKGPRDSFTQQYD